MRKRRGRSPPPEPNRPVSRRRSRRRRSRRPRALRRRPRRPTRRRRKGEKSVVIRAEKALAKVKADERTAAERERSVSSEAHNSAVKAKEAAVANEVTRRQAAKDKET